MIERLRSADVRIAAGIGAAIVIFIGLALGSTLNIWIDEAFTLHTTGAGPRTAWVQADVFEAQPPLYFIIEGCWRLLDENSVVFARFPSIIFSAGAVVIIVLAAYRIAPRIPSLAVAVVSAFNPLVIWAAVEMRVYALVLLVGAILAWTFYEGFLVEKRSRLARIWYTVFAIAGLYTQYYVGFFLAAQAIALLIVRRDSLRYFVITIAVTTVAFAPLVASVIRHVQSSSEFVLPTTLSRAIHEVCDAVFVVLLPHDVSWSGAPKVAGFLFAATLVIALSAIGRPALPRGAAVGTDLQLVICLIVFAALFAIEGVPLASIKYLIVMAPLSLLVAFLFVASFQRMPALMGSIALAAYTLFTLTTLWLEYRPPLVKPGDWQRVAATIIRDHRSIPVAVFPSELTVPLGWYLPVATIPLPVPMRFTLDYVQRTTPTSESNIANVLDPIHDRSERLWLVTTATCDDSQSNYYNYHCRFIENYMHRRYRLIRSTAFRGSLVRLYVRLPPR